MAGRSDDLEKLRVALSGLATKLDTMAVRPSPSPMQSGAGSSMMSGPLEDLTDVLRDIGDKIPREGAGDAQPLKLDPLQSLLARATPINAGTGGQTTDTLPVPTTQGQPTVQMPPLLTQTLTLLATQMQTGVSGQPAPTNQSSQVGNAQFNVSAFFQQLWQQMSQTGTALGGPQQTATQRTLPTPANTQQATQQKGPDDYCERLIEKFNELIGHTAFMADQLLYLADNSLPTGSEGPSPPKDKKDPEFDWKKFADKLEAFLNAKSTGDVVSTAGEVVSIAALGAMGGPIGEAVAGVAIFAIVLGETLQALRRWGEGLQAANFQFAEFSGSMMFVQQEHELRRMELSMNRGENRAGTADDLSQALDNLNRKLAPIEDAWANFMNRFGAGVLTHLGDVADKLTNVLRMLGLLGPDSGAGPDIRAEDIMRGMSMLPWYERHGRPGRFP